MKRRKFVQLAGMGTGALMLPSYLMGSNVSAEALLHPGMDILTKR